MKALVLAAGLGTRLRPLTAARAKPSLPVVGIPALWYGTWHIRRELGIRDFAINMGHAADSVRMAGNDPDLRKFTGVSFHYSDETTQILGSSGALWKLAAWIGTDTLAVCNGDTISLPPWKKMLDFHRAKKALITLHVRKFERAGEPYTDIQIDGDGRVTAIGAKALDGVMFSGSYLFEPELLARLQAGVSELRPSLLEPLVNEGRLFAHRDDIEWFDTGTVASFAHAQLELLRKIPAVRPLVEILMREEAPEVWVPRYWSKARGGFALYGPAVLVGDQAGWAAASSMYGPRFVGLEPPPPGLKVPARDALVYSTYVEKL